MKQIILVIISICAPVLAMANDLSSLFGINANASTVTFDCVEADMQWVQVFEFDPQGNLTTVDGADVKIERDDQGRATSVIMTEEDEDNEMLSVVTFLTYNKEGRVLTARTIWPQEEWSYTHNYDKEGRLLNRLYEAEGDRQVFQYTYKPDTDAEGNWIYRSETPLGAPAGVKQTRIIVYR